MNGKYFWEYRASRSSGPIDTGNWPEVYAIEDALADYHGLQRPWSMQVVLRKILGI